MPNQLMLPAPQSWNLDQVQDLNNLVARTGLPAPRPQDIQTLRNLLRNTPELWQQLGDLPAQTNQGIATQVSPQPIIQESILLSANALRVSLTLPTDTPIEALIIDQCVTHHMYHHVLLERFRELQARGMNAQDGVSWERRVNLSQQRLLNSLETLSRQRRLAQPLMQINIGAHQTNIVTPSAPILNELK